MGRSHAAGRTVSRRAAIAATALGGFTEQQFADFLKVWWANGNGPLVTAEKVNKYFNGAETDGYIAAVFGQIAPPATANDPNVASKLEEIYRNVDWILQQVTPRTE